MDIRYKNYCASPLTVLVERCYSLAAPRLLRSPITAIGVPRYVSGWELKRCLKTTALFPSPQTVRRSFVFDGGAFYNSILNY